MNDSNGLADREIRGLVEAWVAETEPSPDRLEAGLAEVRRLFDEGEPPPSGGGGGPAVGGGKGWSWLPWAGGAAVGVGLLATWPLLQGGGPGEAPASQPADTSEMDQPAGHHGVGSGAPQGERPGPSPSPSRAVPAGVEPAPGGGPVVERTPRKRRTERSKGRRRPGPGRRTEREADKAPETDSLAAELALLRRARSALRAGRYEAALSATRAHARRFPDGVFVQERLATEVTALCGLGRRKEARKRAAAFRRRYPNSKFAARLLAGCSSEGDDTGGA